MRNKASTVYFVPKGARTRTYARTQTHTQRQTDTRTQERERGSESLMLPYKKGEKEKCVHKILFLREHAQAHTRRQRERVS